NENDHSDTPIDLRSPSLADGAAMWRLTRDTGVLDLNSSYQYLLWCRDFSATSVVAVDADEHVRGLITAFLRLDDPSTRKVWQDGVAGAARGQRLASRRLDYRVPPPGPKPWNPPSPTTTRLPLGFLQRLPNATLPNMTSRHCLLQPCTQMATIPSTCTASARWHPLLIDKRQPHVARTWWHSKS